MNSFQKIFLSTTALVQLLACTAQQNKSHIGSYKLVDRINFANDSLLKQLDSFNLDFQFRGNCYAYSSDKYQRPSNGEAHSSNLAQKVTNEFHQDSVFLFINEDELINYGNNVLGCLLYFVNTSDSTIELTAQDSRLDIIAQAQNKEGDWEAISYLPNSWCGNSYHTIVLGENEYWSFNIPIFKGKFKTKMRYVLLMNDIEGAIISNEIDVRINLNQFDKENKQGHNPENIMDPYEE